ncbi:acyl carrier protein [Nitrospira sp. Nam74]
MPEDQTIYSTIEAILLEKLNMPIPARQTDLIESGLLDSLGFVELTAQLEETFGITIPMEKLHINNFRSIAAIADFIIAQQRSQASKEGIKFPIRKE